MANFSYTQVISTPNQSIGEPQNYSASSVISLNEVAANSATTQFNIAIDVSAVKAFAIVSDVAVTIKTNSSTVPDDTIVLVANKPYTWVLDSYDTFKLTVDVTSIFVVVAGTDDATVRIEGVQDATP